MAIANKDQLTHMLVYLVSQGINKSPKIFSEFKVAEEQILSRIRTGGGGGFLYEVTVARIDVHFNYNIYYKGSVEVVDDVKYIEFVRDPDNKHGLKKVHKENLKIYFK